MTDEEFATEQELWYAEKRIRDVDNEIVVFEAGYTRGKPGGWPGDRVWFCCVTKNGLTVEDYATTKRAALRDARKSWRKINQKGWQEQYGYPRKVNCE